MSKLRVLSTLRQLSILSILVLGFCLVMYHPQRSALADACTDSCDAGYNNCTTDCDGRANDCYNQGGQNCDQDRQSCYSSCNDQYNSCLADCSPPPPPPPGDGHVWCDGWDRQGDCAYNHLDAATSSEFRRQRGSGGYHDQTFLTWLPGESDGFGRFPVADGNVGLISTSPATGQIPLYRWSTRKGFKYSVYYANYGGDYVYGGIAGYVWPAGSAAGYPLYQFFSQEYGHFYTNYPSEIRCQQPVYWAFQGAICNVNWPAPIAQAFRVCFNNSGLGFPGSCDPFAVERCQARGSSFNFGNCSCFDGLP